MKFDRRSFVAAAFALGAAVTMPAFAQNAPYTPISPAQPTEDASNIEVIEFFSYGCPHCADFNPLLHSWIAKQQGDVVVKKVPITFGRAAWVNLARLYYALEITGDIAKLDGEVFKAIHVERINLFYEKTVNEWAAKKGVDPKKFNEAFNSFGVQSRVKRGDQMAQTYRIQGVPALAIDGRYLIGERHLANADRLIAQVRSQKKK